MKKIFSSFLAALFVCAFCAISTSCTSAEGKLKMATSADFPPYEYLDENKNIVGIDVEIAQAVAEKIGYELVVEDVSFKYIVDNVSEGKYDIGMSALTVDDERKEKVSFSDTYAKGVQVIIVRDDCPYSKLEEFYASFDELDNPVSTKAGVSIGVEEETTGDTYASAETRDWGFGENNVKRYQTGEEAVKALINGDITAVIIDDGPAEEFVKENTGLHILETAYVEEDYAICVSKNNLDLLGKINNALEELQEDGSIDRIIQKYIS